MQMFYILHLYDLTINLYLNTYNLGFVHRPTQQFVDPSSAEYVTLEMMISETFIGGLIGRCGSNISRIRTESRATIKVHGGKGENKHRQIHLGGSAQQVAMAKQRVDEYLYTQMMQETGGQQSMVDDTSALMAGPMYYPPVPPQAYYGLPNPYAPHL